MSWIYTNQRKIYKHIDDNGYVNSGGSGGIDSMVDQLIMAR